MDGPPPPAPRTRNELRLPPAKDVTKVVDETNEQLQDIYFAYDRADLSPDAVAALNADALLLAPVLHDFPAIRLTIEGHCDERGSAEYNLALGDRRAAHAAAMLQNLGLALERMDTVSYGKERPQCDERREACWQRNRRAHLALRPAPSTPPLP